MAVPKLRQSTRQAEKCQKEQEKLQTELDAMESQPTESEPAKEPAQQKGKGKGKGTIFDKVVKADTGSLCCSTDYSKNSLLSRKEACREGCRHTAQSEVDSVG